MVTMLARLERRMANSVFFDGVVADGFPAEEEVAFLGTAGGLAGGAIVHMDVGGAAHDGVVHGHMAFEALVHVAGLRDVDGSPTAILGLLGVNEIGRERLKRGVEGDDLVGIFGAGMAGPVEMGLRARGLRAGVVTEEIF